MRQGEHAEEILARTFERGANAARHEFLLGRAKAALVNLTEAGWIVLRPDDCCRDKIQDLDAEVWSP